MVTVTIMILEPVKNVKEWYLGMAVIVIFTRSCISLP